MKYCLFDTHAHYDHPLFEGNGPEIARHLFEEGTVDGIVIPAITYESNFNRDKFPEERFPRVFFAAGLHPKCAVNEAWWSEEKRADFECILSNHRTVAVKTGLDFCKKKLTESQKEHQKRFFRLMIGYANEARLPLVLHIRDSAEEVIEVLKEEKLSVKAVAHCYTYDKTVADKMIEVGITHFGIGGMITRDDMEPLCKCVEELPIESILLETDAPFVKPVGYEGNLNTSGTLEMVVEKIATIKNLPIQETVTALQCNAYAFFGVK